MGFRSLLNEQFEVSDGSTDEQGRRVYAPMNTLRQREKAQKPTRQGLGLGTKIAVVAASGYAGWKIGNKLFSGKE